MTRVSNVKVALRLTNATSGNASSNNTDSIRLKCEDPFSVVFSTSRSAAAADASDSTRSTESSSNNNRKYRYDFCADGTLNVDDFYKSCNTEELIDGAIEGLDTGLFVTSVGGSYTQKDRSAIFSPMVSLLLGKCAEMQGVSIKVGHFGLTDNKIVSLLTERAVSVSALVKSLAHHLVNISEISNPETITQQGSQCFAPNAVMNGLTRSMMTLKKLAKLLTQSIASDIPYEESILTSICQNLIGGTGRAIFAVHLDPADHSLQPSFEQILDFLECLRKIKNRERKHCVDARVIQTQEHCNMLMDKVKNLEIEIEREKTEATLQSERQACDTQQMQANLSDEIKRLTTQLAEAKESLHTRTETFEDLLKKERNAHEECRVKLQSACDDNVKLSVTNKRLATEIASAKSDGVAASDLLLQNVKALKVQLADMEMARANILEDHVKIMELLSQEKLRVSRLEDELRQLKNEKEKEARQQLQIKAKLQSELVIERERLAKVESANQTLHAKYNELEAQYFSLDESFNSHKVESQQQQESHQHELTKIREDESKLRLTMEEVNRNHANTKEQLAMCNSVLDEIYSKLRAIHNDRGRVPAKKTKLEDVTDILEQVLNSKIDGVQHIPRGIREVKELTAEVEKAKRATATVEAKLDAEQDLRQSEVGQLHKAKKELERSISDLKMNLENAEQSIEISKKENDSLRRSAESRNRAIEEADKTFQVEREGWEIERKGLISRVNGLLQRLNAKVDLPLPDLPDLRLIPSTEAPIIRAAVAASDSQTKSLDATGRTTLDPFNIEFPETTTVKAKRTATSKAKRPLNEQNKTKEKVDKPVPTITETKSRTRGAAPKKDHDPLSLSATDSDSSGDEDYNGRLGKGGKGKRTTKIKPPVAKNGEDIPNDVTRKNKPTTVAKKDGSEPNEATKSLSAVVGAEPKAPTERKKRQRVEEVEAPIVANEIQSNSVKDTDMTSAMEAEEEVEDARPAPASQVQLEAAQSSKSAQLPKAKTKGKAAVLEPDAIIPPVAKRQRTRAPKEAKKVDKGAVESPNPDSNGKKGEEPLASEARPTVERDSLNQPLERTQPDEMKEHEVSQESSRAVLKEKENLHNSRAEATANSPKPKPTEEIIDKSPPKPGAAIIVKPPILAGSLFSFTKPILPTVTLPAASSGLPGTAPNPMMISAFEQARAARQSQKRLAALMSGQSE
ncbi:hypothetical protein HDU76_000859 [Blyttiomyces sp. JEL0837]|nr:hypothetical protein HDU76_000859 [Blyttiomyces sp. JEL0837]